MPFDASTLADLETILCDGFEYHDAMDTFLLRAGVSAEHLKEARAKAENRNLGSAYARAPKRWVVQELLNRLSATANDVVVSNLVTAVLKHQFPASISSVSQALTHLQAQVNSDRDEIKTRREAERQDRERVLREENRLKEEAHTRKIKARDALKSRFYTLMEEPNAQQRGFLLEQFLNDFFEHEGLNPRRSFRNRGEQIDGSFSFNNKTHLTEAKWVKTPVAGAEFGAFIYKIEGKTADTRGLYISINGYSPEALQGLKQKGALSFVCVDGAHLVRSLEGGQSFSKILETIWRHADETGNAYFPVASIQP